MFSRLSNKQTLCGSSRYRKRQAKERCSSHFLLELSAQFLVTSVLFLWKCLSKLSGLTELSLLPETPDKLMGCSSGWRAGMLLLYLTVVGQQFPGIVHDALTWTPRSGFSLLHGYQGGRRLLLLLSLQALWIFYPAPHKNSYLNWTRCSVSCWEIRKQNVQGLQSQNYRSCYVFLLWYWKNQGRKAQATQQMPLLSKKWEAYPTFDPMFWFWATILSWS